MKHFLTPLLLGLVIGFIFDLIIFTIIAGNVNLELLLVILIILFASFLTIQSIFTLFWMLYAWEDPEEAAEHRSPNNFTYPQYSFTALIPARHEAQVIDDTIRTVHNINYPSQLKETIVLCRSDDTATINQALATIRRLNAYNTRVEIFDGFPINKPYALNKGLQVARNQVVAVFDAEDEPHRDIYNVVNTVMATKQADVVQSGVQLMNYRTKWFSALNCMEYFFWFKSGLHFFSKVGRATPLGGNTVFFKKDYLKKVNGWDDQCLTEDADIGFRLVAAGARIKVVYDEQHATREETPSDVVSFIKQRTRWNQGFLQILGKGSWWKLPTIRQKAIALYILLSPAIQAGMLLYIPVALYLAFTIKLPVVLSLFTIVPLMLFALQIVALCVGMYEFTRAYKLPFPLLIPFKILLTFYPYQLLLMVAAFRATYRFIFNVNGWEKTFHINAHRETARKDLSLQYVE